MIKTVAACGAILGLFLAAARQDPSKAEVKAEKVAGNVYMITGQGGNIGASIGDDGILIVDSQFAPLAPKIEAALKELSEERVRFLINTHWHPDHTGGNAAFADLGTEIIAQENARKRLAGGITSRYVNTPPAAAEALPILTFDHAMSVYVNGEEVRALHVPNGHTDGDCVVFFTQSKVVHMGDDFMNGIFPFIDVASGGSVQGLIAGDEQVLAQVPEDAKIIPGHGPLGTKADLQRFVTMLKDTSAVVAAAIAQKKTLEQMKQEKVLAKWDDFGHGLIKTDQFLELLYETLTKPPTGAAGEHGRER